MVKKRTDSIILPDYLRDFLEEEAIFRNVVMGNSSNEYMSRDCAYTLIIAIIIQVTL